MPGAMLGKSLEDYTAAELDDLLRLLGVRQKILQRSHVDGYRLARLSAAQLRGYPFSALEQWRLHLLRLSHVVFRVLSAGSAVGGACPISALCGALRHKFGFEAEAVDELAQGFLSHSLLIAPSRERVISFDQWAQLFDWVAARLGLHNEDVLQKLGIDMQLVAMPCPRQPLKAVHPGHGVSSSATDGAAANPAGRSLVAALLDRALRTSPCMHRPSAPVTHAAARPATPRAGTYPDEARGYSHVTALSRWDAGVTADRDLPPPPPAARPRSQPGREQLLQTTSLPMPSFVPASRLLGSDAAAQRRDGAAVGDRNGLESPARTPDLEQSAGAQYGVEARAGDESPDGRGTTGAVGVWALRSDSAIPRDLQTHARRALAAFVAEARRRRRARSWRARSRDPAAAPQERGAEQPPHQMAATTQRVDGQLDPQQYVRPGSAGSPTAHILGDAPVQPTSAEELSAGQTRSQVPAVPPTRALGAQGDARRRSADGSSVRFVALAAPAIRVDTSTLLATGSAADVSVRIEQGRASRARSPEQHTRAEDSRQCERQGRGRSRSHRSGLGSPSAAESVDERICCDELLAPVWLLPERSRAVCDVAATGELASPGVVVAWQDDGAKL